MLEALDWMNLMQRIKFNVIVFVFKMKMGLMPRYFKKNLNYNYETHDRNMRNRNDLRLNRVRTESTKKSIFYNGIKMFNELPLGIKSIENIQMFERKYFTMEIL